MSLFENYERRIDKINATLKEYGISSVEECKEITLAKGIDCDKIVRDYFVTSAVFCGSTNPDFSPEERNGHKHGHTRICGEKKGIRC